MYGYFKEGQLVSKVLPSLPPSQFSSHSSGFSHTQTLTVYPYLSPSCLVHRTKEPHWTPPRAMTPPSPIVEPPHPPQRDPPVEELGLCDRAWRRSRSGDMRTVSMRITPADRQPTPLHPVSLQPSQQTHSPDPLSV